jgi:poly(A) polymerase
MLALRDAAADGYYVGGCVRDWLLERPLKDLDIAVPDHVEETGRRVAVAVGGVFFWLREAMSVGRVVVRGESSVHLDFVPLAGTLEEDLRRRDFTINAMAVPAPAGLVPGAPIIDPTGGRGDLAERRLRLAAPDALERDPLRCLRAFRLRTLLGLTFAPGLEAAIRTAAPALAGISGERIRDELFVLLETEQSAPVIAELLAYDLVAPWSPHLSRSAAGDTVHTHGGPGHGGDAPAGGPAVFPPLGTSPPTGLALLAALDRWLNVDAPLLPCAADLNTTLETQVTPPNSRRALARLAALSIGAGAATPTITRSLCLSADETRVVDRAVGAASALEADRPSSGSGRLHFSQRWEPGAVEAALLTLAADQDAPGAGDREEGRSGSLTLLLSYLLERRLRPLPALLTGEEVMAICRLSPGPEVGRCLQRVEEQRADGLLQTPDEAREWLRRGCEAPTQPRET